MTVSGVIRYQERRMTTLSAEKSVKCVYLFIYLFILLLLKMGLL